MDRNETYIVRLIRYRAELDNERCQKRLKEDLGLDEEAVEVIMSLRSQVADLQRRMHELESVLEVYQSGHGSRLTQYRQVTLESNWEEL